MPDVTLLQDNVDLHLPVLLVLRPGGRAGRDPHEAASLHHPLLHRPHPVLARFCRVTRAICHGLIYSRIEEHVYTSQRLMQKLATRTYVLPLF